MEKKIAIGMIFILFVLVSPLVIQGSAFGIFNVKNTQVRSTMDVGPHPFWFICHINSSGIGTAVHSGNDIFIAIEYTEDENASTILRSFARDIELKGSHKFQMFFFVGDHTIPYSGMEGEIKLNGMALLVNLF